MNEYVYLVLIKGKDKTTDVKEVKYRDGKQVVTFNNDMTYEYGYNNVEKIYRTESIYTKNKEIKVSGKHVYNVNRIVFFNHIVKLFFSDGSIRLCHKHDIDIRDIDETQKSTDILKYFKEVANVLKIEIDDDQSFLGKQFERMITVNDSSVLSNYLYNKKPRNENICNHLILPFGFNISQEKATRNAFNSQLSIIEGPPGTGKTQTILNIIANILTRKKTVAIISNNNSATVNVQEKLEGYSLSFISAFLGSRENKENFINNQSGLYPDMSDWKIKQKELNKLYFSLEEDLIVLLELNKSINLRAEKLLELKELELEYKHYLNTVEHINEDELVIKYSRNTDYILGLIDELSKKKKITFFYRIVFWFRYNLSYKKFIKKSLNYTIDLLYIKYYKILISNLNKEIKKLDRLLIKENFDEKKKRYQEKSMKYFKSFLYDKYHDKDDRAIYKDEDIYLNLGAFTEEYPVVLSTTHSLRNMSKHEFLYDYVIVDEASQADIISSALSLSVARNVIIVGDSKQLPHVVEGNVKTRTNNIWNNYDISDIFKFTNSLLDMTKLLFKKRVPNVLLREHYRCDPSIIGFCNKKFYNSELIVLTTSKTEEPLSVFVSVEGNHARGHFNQRQIDIIINEVLPSLDENDTVGIITPFREQANKLIEKFKKSDIDADTVHKYQGRERDVMIISTVSNSIEAGSFVDDKNLINVAISRAKKKLVLVTSKDMLEDKRTNISDLVAYIKYNNFNVQESKIISVFDALYKVHSNKLLKKYTNPRNVSLYKSENIMYELLQEIIEKNQLNHLGVLLQYPLRKLVKDYKLLSDEETKYANHSWTLVDFLVYNKITKKPVLVVEVDGYAYHNLDKVQQVRDEIKNKILDKSKLKILRLNTTGSNEKLKIEKLLV